LTWFSDNSTADTILNILDKIPGRHPNIETRNRKKCVQCNQYLAENYEHEKCPYCRGIKTRKTTRNWKCRTTAELDHFVEQGVSDYLIIKKCVKCGTSVPGLISAKCFRCSIDRGLLL
tara:strand:- start:157 stop:510 length:354 start_codon:yes stop_codon:yes gene_type:complete